ncbi:MAG: glycosyltransferase [Rubripirellula sp.]
MHPQTNTNDSSISLILPAWNESEVIVHAIEEADAALRLVADDYEIIVVDDGSTDGTADLVRTCVADHPAVRLISHNPNQGYGAALRTGFAAAEKELVMFTDADCQFDLTELDRFVLLSKRFDVVCGYRIDRKDTALRCLYSRVYNQMVRVLLQTGVRDVDCAMKLFHRDVIRSLNISGDGFLVNSELLTQVNQRGLSLVEVGVSHRLRTEGNSKVSIAHIPRVLASLARYWWNSVQFPGLPTSHSADKPRLADTTTTANASIVNDRQAGWLQLTLLVVAALFLLTNLGYPLIDRDETRYAEIPREMIATGNWVVPQLNFQTYYDKPPLLYWLCAASFKLFGMSESAARLVPALAAFATLASTMFFGTRWFGRQIGLFAGGVLMLSVGFAFTSRYLLLDGVLSLMVCTSLFAAYESIRGGKVKMNWWLVSAIACGLGFMTKGPVALVLWLPPVFAMAWLSDGHAKPRWWHYGIVGGVVAMIAMPWLIAVSRQDPDFLVQFFWVHNLGRFAGEFHSQPIWYFVPVLLVAGHPWSFLTIPYARFLFAKKSAAQSQRPLAIGFLLLWTAWCFAFFSCSSCKLPTYVLPAAPALALMIGHYLDQMMRQTRSQTEHWFAIFWSARGATVATCLSGVGFVVFVIAMGIEVPSTIYLWAMMWAGMLVMAVLLINDRHQSKLAWASSSAAAFLFAIMVMHQMVPAYSRDQTLFGADSPLERQIAFSMGGLATQPITTRPIATVSHEFSEVPFYLGRSDIPNFDNVRDVKLAEYVGSHPGTLLVIQNRVDPTLLRQSLPAGTKITPLGKRGPGYVVEVTSPNEVAKPIPHIAGRHTAKVMR